MRASGLLAFLLVQSVGTASASAPLAFHLTPQGAIIVPVIVNGTGPVSFVIDTGSTSSAISEDLAAALGAKPVARTTMMSAAGQKDALVTRIEHLAMGDVVARDVLMTLVQPEAFGMSDVVASGRNVQGIIGQDVLATLRYTIDYRERTIVWHEAGAGIPRRAAALALELQDDRFLVVLPQHRDALRLVPDSGADTLVLFQRDGGIHPDMTLAAESFQLTTLAGTRLAQRAVVHGLRVGAATMRDLTAVIVGREEGSPSADGLLPLHIFARVTFNGPERQLLLELDAPSRADRRLSGMDRPQ
jgi:aspartyl protease